MRNISLVTIGLTPKNLTLSAAWACLLGAIREKALLLLRPRAAGAAASADVSEPSTGCEL